MKRLTAAQSRVMHFVNQGGVIEASYYGCRVELRKIPYKFNRRTLSALIDLNLIKPVGSIGLVQMYVKQNPL